MAADTQEGQYSGSTPEEKQFSEEELDRQVQEALSCPCVDDIKSGPCGSTFVNAFSCYMKCQARQQEVDCLSQFTDLQTCMSKHPAAFANLAETMEEASSHAPAAAATQ